MSINNNINLRNFPLSDNPLPNHSLTSSLFSELALQAAYLKHQLSQALTINSSLIHRAQKYEDLPTIQNIL